MTTHSRIQHFPVTLFGMCMGVMGLALALRAGGMAGVSAFVGWSGAFLIVAFLGALAAKGLLHPASLRADWEHPIRIAFFPAISVSLLLLGAFLLPLLPGLAEGVWLLGALMHGLLTVLVLSAWIGQRSFGPVHMTPVWFIPIVGNAIAPVAGVGLGYLELSWYFFSVGLGLWLSFLALVFNRLIFHEPLPGKLRPTLVILIAPPSVGALSWMQLHGGQVDDIARMLLNLGFFFALLVATKLPGLLRLPFALSFWALTFPVAALSIVSFHVAKETGVWAYHAIGSALLCILAISVVALLVRTAQAARAGAICVPEG